MLSIIDGFIFRRTKGVVMDERLIWIDLEMTGLEPNNDRIVEIATIVTDAHLNEIATGPELAIYQSKECLAGMGDWVRQQHQKSGLIARIEASETTEAQAEAQTLAFLTQHVKPGISPMCGNSICMDRRFLYRHMPKLEAFFHYRHVDVSTLKELAKRWYPQLDMPKKISQHLALSDIRDSIEELRFYRQALFQNQGE